MNSKKNIFRNLSIRVKFILGIVLILIITTLSLSLVFIKRSEHLLIDALEDKTHLLNKNFSIVSAQGISESSFSNLQSLINEVAMKDREIRALIVAYPNGMVIATSDTENFRQFSKIKDESIVGQVSRKENRIFRDRDSRLLKSVHLVFSQPLSLMSEEEEYGEDEVSRQEEPGGAGLSQKELLGFIYTELDTSHLEESVFRLWLYSALIALILMGGGVVCAYGFGSAMSRPVVALAAEVRVIASGNLENAIRSDSRDEIGQLVGDVESMRVSIKDLTENLEQKVRERTRQLQEATDHLAEANKEITELNEQLKEENIRLGAELEVTRRLQKMVLPPETELERIEGLEIACHMEPADEVGGDYYDVLRYDGSTKIGIGDVTGHGLESGVVMLMTQVAVRTLLTSGEKDPVRFLNILNRTIHDNVQRMKVDKSMTLSLLDYVPFRAHEKDGGEVRLSGQHEEMIVVRQGGKIERVDTINLGMPIALVDDIGNFVSEASVSLETGDVLVLYSDGITEAENMEGKFYGMERLCELISRNWDKSAKEIKDTVVRDVYEYIGKQVVYDDITLMVMKQQ